MYGRTDWYQHEYIQKELVDTATLIRDAGADRAYIFFNNDHTIFENAQQMQLFQQKRIINQRILICRLPVEVFLLLHSLLLCLTHDLVLMFGWRVNRVQLEIGSF